MISIRVTNCWGESFYISSSSFPPLYMTAQWGHCVQFLSSFCAEIFIAGLSDFDLQMLCHRFTPNGQLNRQHIERAILSGQLKVHPEMQQTDLSLPENNTLPGTMGLAGDISPKKQREKRSLITIRSDIKITLRQIGEQSKLPPNLDFISVLLPSWSESNSMETMKNLLSIVLIAYGLLALLLVVFQRSFLYFPSQQKPGNEILYQENLRAWPNDKTYRGVTSTSEMPNAAGTVVVFHGNAGAAYHRYYYVNALSKLNLRVILAEYPGYGGRSGEPSEATLVKDAIETVDLAYQTYGAPIYLWGESLGAGVVSGTVAKSDVPIKGLVLLTPWDSLPALAQTHYWYLPARWLVRDHYNSVENISSFKGNVAMVLAERDEIIPINHGQRLYESMTTNKRLWLFKGAGHNTLPVSEALAWWREVSEFIAQ